MDAPRGAGGSAPVREPPFELTFRLEAGDYQAFLRKLSWRAIERVVLVLPAVAVTGAGALVGFWTAGGSFERGWSLPVTLAGALIGYLLYRSLITPVYYGALFAGQPLALGDTKVVADMRGVGTYVAEIVIAMPWSRVVRVVETDGHVFLMFARLAGVIVPKRAFESAEQGKRFVSFARSMTTASRR